MAVARERNHALRELASRKKASFMGSMVGTVVQAITLQTIGADFTEALTDNYLKIKIPGRYEANRWMKLSVEMVVGEVLRGKSVTAASAEHRSYDELDMRAP